MPNDPVVTIKLKPFTTPNFVIPVMPAGLRQDGFKPVDGIPLSAIDADVLAQMCKAFRAEVFKKAGKADPTTVQERRINETPL